MTCATTPRFTISLNREHFGFFKCRRGLRQKDPLSPLPFVLVMDYLNRVLKLSTQAMKFQFLPLCKRMQLAYLCFADDLLLFYKAQAPSTKSLMAVFDHFSQCFGLRENQDKPQMILVSVDKQTREFLRYITEFSEGSLPLKYLLVPVKSSRLDENDGQILLDNIFARIRSWPLTRLTNADKVERINSVLISAHSYCGHIFILPQYILTKVNKAYKTFLWEDTKVPQIAW